MFGKKASEQAQRSNSLEVVVLQFISFSTERHLTVILSSSAPSQPHFHVKNMEQLIKGTKAAFVVPFAIVNEIAEAA